MRIGLCAHFDLISFDLQYNLYIFISFYIIIIICSSMHNMREELQMSALCFQCSANSFWTAEAFRTCGSVGSRPGVALRHEVRSSFSNEVKELAGLHQECDILKHWYLALNQRMDASIIKTKIQAIQLICWSLKFCLCGFWLHKFALINDAKLLAGSNALTPISR